ncbi:unnamed protein product [Cochlearia groenlandica]
MMLFRRVMSSTRIRSRRRVLRRRTHPQHRRYQIISISHSTPPQSHQHQMSSALPAPVTGMYEYPAAVSVPRYLYHFVSFVD